jgi:U32 family peptidase
MGKKTLYKNLELLAPAGSYESLLAAIQAGADAVYFGVGELNMRAHSSKSFELKDIRKIVAICSKNNVRTYLTVNTVIYDKEVARMHKIVSAAKKWGISAIIASDQSVINYARSVNMPVHISTQVNISNSEAVKFYSAFADVMVLARELNLDQVKKIHRGIIKEKISGPSGKPVKLEMFVHGALCMSVSGKCYLSLHEHNHSANRGACLQSCRRAYLVEDRESGTQLEIENEYIMSPKDLCTIGFLDKIIESGASVFKIEGRARSPEYVKTVTECYREAIDSVLDGTYSKEKIERWTNRLNSVFNRGFWDGYYLGQRLGEWNDSYGSKATKKKIYIGKSTNYYSKIGVAEFLIENKTLKPGDEVLIIGPSTGVVELTIDELRTGEGPQDVVKKGDVCAFKVKEFIRKSDKLYKLVDSNPVGK